MPTWIFPRILDLITKQLNLFPKDRGVLSYTQINNTTLDNFTCLWHSFHQILDNIAIYHFYYSLEYYV